MSDGPAAAAHLEKGSEPTCVEAEIKREEIAIERVPANEGEPTDKAFEGEEIPLRREEPVIEKQVRVRERVQARKTAQTEQQTVPGEVGREDIEVEEERKEPFTH